MTIANRLKRLESAAAPVTPCLCNRKAFLAAWRGESDAQDLTACPKCKGRHDFWAGIADELRRPFANLTDREIETANL